MLTSNRGRFLISICHQYETEDVQVLQKALDRYKADLAALEATSNQIYGSVEKELTQNDRYDIHIKISSV